MLLRIGRHPRQRGDEDTLVGRRRGDDDRGRRARRQAAAHQLVGDRRKVRIAIYSTIG